MNPSGSLSSTEELREAYPPASERSLRKELDHLDHHCARFISLSPFCVLATVGDAGGPDMSPRGGDPGFVRVLDPQTLLLPDRPGNYRIDSLTNAVSRPAVALLFLVPGIDETLRVYGRASLRLLRDEDREVLGVDRKGRSALHLEVTKAYFHCAKALMRSALWNPEQHIERSEFPTMGQLMAEHTGMAGRAETQEEMLERYLPSM
jgi:PPOX class probable FMN-dependent enzyme